MQKSGKLGVRTWLVLTTCVLFLSTALCVSACNNNKTQKIPADIAGYTRTDVSGGETFEQANLLDVAPVVSEDNNTTQIRLSFVKGSVIADVPQTDTAKPLKYTVSVTDAPQRLLITMPAPEYIDFVRSFNTAFPENNNLWGAFYYTDNSAKTITISVQFKTEMYFKTEEEAGDLVISVKSADVLLSLGYSPDSFSYFVTANALSEYMTAPIDGLCPTLTRQNAGKILISSPYTSERDANDALYTLRTTNPSIASAFEVIACYHNELPIYNASLDGATAANALSVRKDGTPISLPVAIPNGLFLCDTPDGDCLYAAEHADGDSKYYTLAATGKSTVNVSYQFEHIERAEYSPDYTRLAVLENTSGGSRLVVFDPVSGEITADLTDAGIGKRVSAFVWNDTGTCIYTISGTGSIALCMYDFTVSVTADAERITTVYSDNVDESSLAVADGCIYFVRSDENGSGVYRLRTGGGAAVMFAPGSCFELSSDKKLMAISTAGAVASSDTQKLSVYALESGEETVIADEFAIYTFMFSYDSKSIYYVKDNLSGKDDESAQSTAAPDSYPYTLYRATVAESKTNAGEVMFDMRQSTLAISKSALMLPYTATDGSGICATMVGE